MTIDISDLIRGMVNSKKEYLVFETDVFLQENEDIQFVEPVKLDSTLDFVGDIIYLDGRLTSKLRFSCSRCLEEFYTDIDIEIHEKFSNNLNNKDDDINFIEGDVIDINNIIENNIEMALPIKKLCNEDCKGLCHNCGINLNISNCECEKGNVDPRLKKLGDLFSTY
jgi:uncharacterized protein